MLAAQNGGHPVLPAQSRRALITRNETMSGIWRWPRAEAQSGNLIAAENYYQHAEHYFRMMSSDRGAT